MKTKLQEAVDTIAQLAEKEQVILATAAGYIAAALSNEDGCALLLVDVGDGKLNVMTLGETENIIPLFDAATSIHETLMTPEGTMQ